MIILDTTIRDGSYAVDFKFSCTDVADIISKLEKLGFEYIEIGHGLGLNASSAKYGYSLHSDLEYMQTAQRVLKKSKFGFFCIPDIARLEDIKLAADNGVSFIRVGINANMVEKTEPYLKEAKKRGLFSTVNLMKSYILPPSELAEKIALIQGYGADVAYLVDSAGCMLPEDIETYSETIKKKTNIMLGFHGHNNLGLAVSNSLKCIQLGFDFIDCSLQGLGRSLGNAPTEQLIMILKKQGYPLDVDVPRLLEYGYTIINDVSKKTPMHPLDLICGYSGFHSSFLKDIYRCCNEKNVDPMRLIIAYSNINRATMDYNLLCKVADELPKDLEENPYNFREFFSILFND
jgi:4-hydroxy 2-oxovalerate aldolase/long-chain acyl-CoA synthetase